MRTIAVVLALAALPWLPPTPGRYVAGRIEKIVWGKGIAPCSIWLKEWKLQISLTGPLALDGVECKKVRTGQTYSTSRW